MIAITRELSGPTFDLLCENPTWWAGYTENLKIEGRALARGWAVYVA